MTFRSYLPGSLKSLSNENLIAIAILIVVVVIALVYFFNKGYEYFDGGAPDKAAPSTVVTLYAMDGCPHCVAFKPEWEKFNANLPEGVTAKQYGPDDSQTQAAGVSGFPTIIITKDGKDTVYEGERTAEGITSFLSAA